MSKVSLADVRSANVAFAMNSPLTAVFTGGTSGIGEYTIHTIATYYGQSQHALRIYIVGRNAQSAARIISECRELCPQGQFDFVQAGDLSLIRDTDVICNEIVRLETHRSFLDGLPACIDLLVMSHADLHFGGRRETKEGLDKTHSLMYYSRMRFASNLIPLLRASSRPAHVISIFGAGLEKLKSWNPDDLSLRNGQYSMDRCRTHTIMMKAMLMEKLAEENVDKIAFAHIFPGLVITPAFVDKSHPWWFKAMWAVLGPLAKVLMSTSPSETGERMFYLASSAFPPKSAVQIGSSQRNSFPHVAMSTNGLRGGGSYSCNQYAGTNDVGKIYAQCREQRLDVKVVDHTMQVFGDIERGGIFRG